ncbi:hypothetical protein C4D60_Mb06t15740 [Musa balbisiana]|uniref:Uncharacterized protein n=1 Tax=Musa balbisiana TaxID=52838 RepID=A0A4V4H3Y6_MUSBA|nr:hypothetical protein C4D60_Mb06t15740 [Musa balbisiana]
MTDHFPFVIPDPATTFADPFAPDPVAGFAAPPGGGHLDHGPFRLSDFGSSASVVAAEFDSDEWIESLIGDSPAESSDLMGDPWQGAADGSGALFADAFPSCSTDFSPPSPPASASDLNNVLFSEHCEIAPLAPVQHLHQTAAVVALNRPGPTAHAPSFDPSELNKNSGGAAIVRDQAPESSVSSQPLLESLLDCARWEPPPPRLSPPQETAFATSLRCLGPMRSQHAASAPRPHAQPTRCLGPSAPCTANTLLRPLGPMRSKQPAASAPAASNTLPLAPRPHAWTARCLGPSATACPRPHLRGQSACVVLLSYMLPETTLARPARLRRVPRLHGLRDTPAQPARLRRAPRPHDPRHTCAASPPASCSSTP